jgi:hypothetical protein
MRGDDNVVYLVSTVDERDQTPWIVSVNTERKSVGEITLCSIEVVFIFNPTYILCLLTKHLDSKSGHYRCYHEL